MGELLFKMVLDGNREKLQSPFPSACPAFDRGGGRWTEELAQLAVLRNVTGEFLPYAGVVTDGGKQQ